MRIRLSNPSAPVALESLDYGDTFNDESSPSIVRIHLRVTDEFLRGMAQFLTRNGAVPIPNPTASDLSRFDKEVVVVADLDDGTLSLREPCELVHPVSAEVIVTH